jgi:hypothetical protein
MFLALRRGLVIQIHCHDEHAAKAKGERGETCHVHFIPEPRSTWLIAQPTVTRMLAVEKWKKKKKTENYRRMAKW